MLISGDVGDAYIRGRGDAYISSVTSWGDVGGFCAMDRAFDPVGGSGHSCPMDCVMALSLSIAILWFVILLSLLLSYEL